MENLWGEQSWTKKGGKLCWATKEGKGEIASWRIGEIKIFFQENRAGKKTFSAGAQITFITRGGSGGGRGMKRRESFASFHAGKEKFNPLLPPPPFLLLHLSSDFFDWVFAPSSRSLGMQRGKGERGL